LPHHYVGLLNADLEISLSPEYSTTGPPPVNTVFPSRVRKAELRIPSAVCVPLQPRE